MLGSSFGCGVFAVEVGGGALDADVPAGAVVTAVAVPAGAPPAVEPEPPAGVDPVSALAHAIKICAF